MNIRADKLTKIVPVQGSPALGKLTQGKPERPGLLLADNTLTILHEVSIEIESEKIVGILGVSGSGKSTLLGILAGLDLPTEGKVWWQDQEISALEITALNEDARAKLRLKNASFVFQNFELLPAYTALENVLLPLELVENPDADYLAKEALEAVGLSHRLQHYPNQLSGGEQQRVAIARAFAVQPKILFADEPTGNLDQATGAQIIQLLFDLNARYRTTLVCVTHDPALREICHRIFHIAGGRIVEKDGE